MCEQNYTNCKYECGHREVEKAGFEYCAIAVDNQFTVCSHVKDVYSTCNRSGKCYNCIDNKY